mgnify:CR=1 FL=1
MGNFDNFIERMKKEKEGFAEIWERNRIMRELDGIRAYRLITQQELSEKTGLKQEALSRFFNCKNEPKIGTVIKVAKALGLKLELTEDKEV